MCRTESTSRRNHIPPLVILLSLSLGFGVVLQGCVSSDKSPAIDQDQVDQIKVDVSTKEDVRRILGQPNSMSKHSDSGSYAAMYGLPPTISLKNFQAWSYTDVAIDVHPGSHFPILRRLAHGTTTRDYMVTVIFDEQGIVREISTTQVQGRSGIGAGGQSRPVAGEH